MKKVLSVSLFLLLVSTNIKAESFWCWLIDLQGCPGVAPKGGNAITMGNRGTARSVLDGGARVDRVERRTIIRIPDYRIRRIKRFFGLGGSSFINSSFAGSEGCDFGDGIRPTFQNALMDNTSFRSCLNVLDADIDEYPSGIGLRTTNCQQYFCEPSFIERFDEFLSDRPHIKIRNPKHFLQCEEASVEI